MFLQTLNASPKATCITPVKKLSILHNGNKWSKLLFFSIIEEYKIQNNNQISHIPSENLVFLKNEEFAILFMPYFVIEVKVMQYNTSQNFTEQKFYKLNSATLTK